jgi:hypothetical protein
VGAATLVDNIDPSRLRELMVERDVDVADKTVYTVLHGNPVRLHTAARIYRALEGDRRGFFAAAA